MGAALDPDADRARARDGQGTRLEAGHDRDQLGRRDRHGDEGRSRKCGACLRERRGQLWLPEEQRCAEVRERSHREAVSVAAGALRPERCRPEEHLLLLRDGEGVRRGQAALLGREEPDPAVADGGYPEDQLGQPVHDQGDQGEDEQDGSLPDLTDQADALHERGLPGVRSADQGPRTGSVVGPAGAGPITRRWTSPSPPSRS
jgi:hypothetical protein